MVATSHKSTIDAVLVNPSFLAHPYPVYARLREDVPVYWSSELRYWFVSRYEDIKSILMDPICFSSSGWDQLYLAELSDYSPGKLQALEQHFAFPSLVSADPPVHTRLRRLVHRVFTPAAIERIRGHVENTIRDLLNTIDTGDCFDAIRDLAVPLPINVFAYMFGVPSSDHDLLKATSADFTAFVSNVRPNWSDAQRANRSLGVFRSYLRVLLEDRRKSPRLDLASVLVSEDTSGDVLDYDELLSLCAHLLIAGHETTTNLIANGLFGLLSHPDQLALLRSRPGLAPQAIEEMLRWEAPLQRVKRIATQTVKVGDVTIEQGDRLMLLLGAANRDSSVFENPNAFNIVAAPTSSFLWARNSFLCWRRAGAT